MPSQRQQLLRDIQGKLKQHYGEADAPLPHDPFDALCLAILRQNSEPEKSEAALRMLKQNGIASSEAVRGIAPDRLVELLKALPQAKNKAQRLQRIFAWLEARFADSFAALQSISTESLHEDIIQLPGIGPETADQILLYGFGRARFPVNQAAYRILSRHYLIGEDAEYTEIQEVLQSVSEAAADYRELRAGLKKLAQQHCRAQPDCDTCPLNGLNW